MAEQDPEQLELIQSYIGDVVPTELIPEVSNTGRKGTHAEDLVFPSEMDSVGTSTVYSDRNNQDDVLVVE